ncbi:MAG: ABC-type transport auxiliary lipoprotein family protein [Deltaproteobacteria bacterium]|jgi:cholesterol transport system auxiliary component|nr:ABC-type transport auxiliary lipoprotein family protein [Deltaproteobacteria bacterium]
MKIFLCLAVLLLSACGGILNPGPPPARIQMHPALPAKAPFVIKKQLLVAMPQTEGDMDSDGIDLLFQGRELRHLADARWISPVPRMIQHAIIDAIQASGGLSGVADDLAGISANARLLCDLRRFCLRYGAENTPPEAWFQATLRLVDQSNGRLLGATSLDISVPAASNGAADLIRAMESALQQALAGVTAWTLEQMR